MEKIRLQKFLAECGIASRRKSEEYITDGRVKVNGKIETELGIKIDPEIDKVYFDGKLVKKNDEKVYILLNKPIGYVTTVKDQFNRKTVMDLVKINQKVVPVGRLDMYTSGALILTNDGDFVYKITHPKHEVEKTYNVTIKGDILKDELNLLRNGVMIDGYKTKSAKVRILKKIIDKNLTRIEVIIHEGRNRQIRKMFKSINKSVVALHRSKIGNICVNDMKIGTWRYLTIDEVNSLL